jgi:hypothetical protein
VKLFRFLLVGCGKTLVVLEWEATESNATPLRAVTEFSVKFPIVAISSYISTVLVATQKGGLMFFKFREESRKLELKARYCRRSESQMAAKHPHELLRMLFY